MSEVKQTASPVISVTGLSRSFPLYRKPLDVVKEGLFNKVKHDLFWALRDISFEVLEKQRVGIIGQNGAGKSTLLQTICGNLRPTSGSVQVRGKISALMSLVPAWNLEETGLENIKFNLLMQGYNPKLIPNLVEEIIDFTELGGFIFRPVKTYSSGMSARLSFAIATAIIPEILIIDEVLGVGDGYFANKATKRVKELCDRGKALLFVSHSLAAVRSMCNKVIWLENGSIRLMGDSDFVISQYEEDIIKSEESISRAGNMARLAKHKQYVVPEDIADNDYLCQFRIREENEEKILGSHYVRNIKYSNMGSDEANEISLFHSNIAHSNVDSALELIASEWGRLYTKNGVNCRILTSRAGGKNGGYLSIKRPDAFYDKAWPVQISLEVSSSHNKHPLGIDFLNLQTLSWEKMNLDGVKNIGDGWSLISFTKEVPANKPTNERLELIEQLKTIRRSPAEILQISIIKDEKVCYSIKEAEPFIMRVHIRSHEVSSSISVNINIIRSDGVFAFFQPSGIVKNIENFAGEATIDFEFNQNLFGAGEYQVNVFACNGWGWDNIPPSDIFDRSIGVFRFSVIPAHPIPFGIINTRVPVKISLLETELGEKCV